MLAEIGKREGEGRRHAQPLRDAQKRESREVGRMCEQRGRDGEQDEARQDPLSAIDFPAEIADGDKASWLGSRYVEGNNVYEDDEAAKAEIVSINKRIYAIHAENDTRLL